MPILFHFRKTIALAALAVTSVAVGQEVQQKAPPADLEIIDEVDQPAITIRKPDTTGEITEKRQGGMVEEIKVKSGPSTYYLYPNGPNGVPGSFMSNEVRPAQQQEPLNAPALPPPSMK